MTSKVECDRFYLPADLSLQSHSDCRVGCTGELPKGYGVIEQRRVASFQFYLPRFDYCLSLGELLNLIARLRKFISTATAGLQECANYF